MGGLRDAKSGAKDYAGKVVQAAGRYADTDQELGDRLGQRQFGRNGAPGQAGGPGGAGGPSGAGAMGGMGQMGEMMQMPMQMAGQALQAPMQAVGMLGSLPQTLMQSVGGMAGMGGHGGQYNQGVAKSLDPPTDSQQDKDKSEDQQGAPDDKRDKQPEAQHQAAGPQREPLEPTPDLGLGASGEHRHAPSAPVTPAPAPPATPSTQTNL